MDSNLMMNQSRSQNQLNNHYAANNAVLAYKIQKQKAMSKYSDRDDFADLIEKYTPLTYKINNDRVSLNPILIKHPF